MSITPLPPPPSSSDPGNFDDRADELLAVSLPLFITEANELQIDVTTKQGTASAAATTATEQAAITTTKAGQANTSAGLASDSAGAAATSEAAALAHKNAAGVSAGNAATSEVAAATSAASVDAQGFATGYAGPTEPVIKWPYMRWTDTSVSPAVVRRRNAANTAWGANARLKAAPSADGDDVTVRSEIQWLGQTLGSSTKAEFVNHPNGTGKAYEFQVETTANGPGAFLFIQVDGTYRDVKNASATSEVLAVEATIPAGAVLRWGYSNIGGFAATEYS